MADFDITTNINSADDFVPELTNENSNVAPKPQIAAPLDNGNLPPAPIIDPSDTIDAKLNRVSSKKNEILTNSFTKSFDFTDTHKAKTSNNPISDLLFGDYYSRYDEYLPGADNEHLNALKQSGVSKAFNSTMQTLYGLGQSAVGYIASNKDMLDVVAKQDLNELWKDDVNLEGYKMGNDVRDMFPIYHNKNNEATTFGGKLYNYMPWTGHFGENVANLWANTGFTIGMIGATILEDTALGAMAIPSSGTSLGVAAVRTGVRMKKVWDSWSRFSRGMKAAENLADVLKTAKTIDKYKEYAKVGGMTAWRAVQASISEGQIEAMSASEEQKAMEIAAFRAEYGRDPNKFELKGIEDRATKVGMATLGINQPILLASNALQFGTLMRTGRLISKNTNEYLRNAVFRSGKFMTKKQAASESGKIALGAYVGKKVAKAMIPEGLEEVGQKLGAETAKTYYSKYSEDAGLSFFDSLSKVTSDELKSGDIWDDFISGMMIGGIFGGVRFVSNKVKGKYSDEVSYLDETNKNISNSVGGAAESLGKDYGILGHDIIVGHQIDGGVEGQVAAIGQVAEATEGNIKESQDFRDQGLKTLLYTAYKSGKSGAIAEIMSNYLDSISNEDYASNYMANSEATVEDIQADKEMRKQKLERKMSEFSESMEGLEFYHKNPYNYKTDPVKYEAFDGVLREMAFYKFDAMSSLERAGQVMGEVAEKINEYNNALDSINYGGQKIEVEDLEVLTSGKVLGAKLEKLKEEKELLELTAKNSNEGSVKMKSDAAAKELDKKISILEELKESSQYNEVLSDTEQQKKATKARAKYIDSITNNGLKSEHPVSKMIADMVKLNAEGDYFLTLYNTLIGSEKAFNKFMVGYYREAIAIHRANKERAAEEAKKDIGEEEIDEIESASQFLLENKNDIAEIFPDKEMSEITSEDIDEKIKDLDENATPENIDKISFLTNLKDALDTHKGGRKAKANQKTATQEEKNKEAIKREALKTVVMSQIRYIIEESDDINELIDYLESEKSVRDLKDMAEHNGLEYYEEIQDDIGEIIEAIKNVSQLDSYEIDIAVDAIVNNDFLGINSKINNAMAEIILLYNNGILKGVQDKTEGDFKKNKKSKYEKRREKGLFTEDGVTHTRQPEKDGIIGNKTRVKFADKVIVEVEYQLIENDEMQPAHINGVRNSAHFIPEVQPKERTDKASMKQSDDIGRSPDFFQLGENSLAYSGAPVVNERGEVIQGNNRGEGIKKSYQKGDSYKSQLAENAEKFGFTREQVESMNKPVLVRVVKVGDREAIELGNYDAKDIETGGTRRIDPVATSRRINNKTKKSIADVLFGEDFDGNVKASIRSNAGQVLKLIKPYLSETQVASMSNNNKFTKEAISDLEGLVLSFLFDGADMKIRASFENLPYNSRMGILKGLGAILKLDSDKSIVKEIQEAIMYASDYINSDASNIDTWSNQIDAFRGGTPKGRMSELEYELFKIFVKPKSQKQISSLFNTYSNTVSDKSSDIFYGEEKGKTKEEGLKQVFYKNTPTINSASTNTKESQNLPSDKNNPKSLPPINRTNKEC